MTSAIQVAIRNQIQASIVVKQVVLENQQIISQIEALAKICLSALNSGGKIIFAGNEVAFTGCITRIEDRGQNKGFTLISLSATEYEAITY
jgi:phosphoheptose isomerase